MSHNGLRSSYTPPLKDYTYTRKADPYPMDGNIPECSRQATNLTNESAAQPCKRMYQKFTLNCLSDMAES